MKIMDTIWWKPLNEDNADEDVASSSQDFQVIFAKNVRIRKIYPKE